MTIPTHPDSSQLSSGFQSSRLSLSGSRDMDPIGSDGTNPDCDAGRERRRPEPKPGEAFGKLVAIESAGRDDRGRLHWLFECACGRREKWQVANVTYNLRKLGWCSCRACYAEAGGWAGIVATMKQRRAEPKAETQNHRDTAHVERETRTKSHRAISHRAQVRESASSSESCADVLKREEARA